MPIGVPVEYGVLDWSTSMNEGENPALCTTSNSERGSGFVELQPIRNLHVQIYYPYSEDDSFKACYA